MWNFTPHPFVFACAQPSDLSLKGRGKVRANLFPLSLRERVRVRGKK
jgi:hypothetical protein